MKDKRVTVGGVTMVGGEVLTQGWRAEHAERGDLALEEAHRLVDMAASVERAQAWAMIAAAHYAAANVRAKPTPKTEGWE